MLFVQNECATVNISLKGSFQMIYQYYLAKQSHYHLFSWSNKEVTITCEKEEHISNSNMEKKWSKSNNDRKFTCE